MYPFMLWKPIFAIDFLELAAAVIADETVMQVLQKRNYKLQDWKLSTSQYSRWITVQFNFIQFIQFCCLWYSWKCHFVSKVKFTSLWSRVTQHWTCSTTCNESPLQYRTGKSAVWMLISSLRWADRYDLFITRMLYAYQPIKGEI
jgi:hypothetical protein